MWLGTQCASPWPFWLKVHIGLPRVHKAFRTGSISPTRNSAIRSQGSVAHAPTASPRTIPPVRISRNRNQCSAAHAPTASPRPYRIPAALPHPRAPTASPRPDRILLHASLGFSILECRLRSWKSGDPASSSEIVLLLFDLCNTLTNFGQGLEHIHACMHACIHT